MTDATPSPWMTRAEAAQYLGFADSETLDRHMDDSKEFRPGKIRFARIAFGEDGRNHIRIWRADVMALLPPLEL